MGTKIYDDIGCDVTVRIRVISDKFMEIDNM